MNEDFDLLKKFLDDEETPPQEGNVLTPDKSNVSLSIGKSAQETIGAKVNTPSTFQPPVPTVEDYPTPVGGVGMLLFLALLIVFSISKVPGLNVTRLQLIWGSLLGNYAINRDVGNSETFTPTSYIQGVY